MENMFETLVMPHANELGLRRCTEAHKPAGVTLTCNPEMAEGFLWTHCAENGMFAISIMDIRLGELVSARYDHPEFYALNLMNRDKAFDTWREGLEAYTGTQKTLKPATASTEGGGIIGYHQKEGTFSSPIAKGQKVRSMELQLAPEYISELSDRFYLDREIIEDACFDFANAGLNPAAELAMRQMFAANPSQACADMFYEGRVLELLSLIIEKHLMDQGMTQRKPTDPDSAGIERAIGYIHEHLNDSVKLGALERIAAMGHSKLSRLFYEKTGMAPIEYLRYARMKRAAALLSDTVMTIDSVASAVGYENPGAFAERFKKEFEVTPSEYRKTLR